MRRSLEPAGALAAKFALLWTGLCLGVAFLATPAKFLAPSISLPIALDVGRQTFMVADRVEIALCLLVTGLALASPRRSAWAIAYAPIAAVVALQAAWLIPTLDARVGLILAGQTPPPSSLHIVYIAIEAGKAAWLGVLGFTAWPWRLSRVEGLGRVLPTGGKVVSLHGGR